MPTQREANKPVKVQGNPGSCTWFILFNSCYCNDGSKYVINNSERLYDLDHCYSKCFIWVSLFLLFIKETVCEKSLSYYHLIQISVSSLTQKAPLGHMQARSQSPTTAQNPSFLPPLGRRKRVFCHRFSDTRRWWSLGWLSFNFHSTSPYSSYQTVITTLGASCHAWIGQWRENLSKCYLQTLGIRSEGKHLNYIFSSLLCLKTRHLLRETIQNWGGGGTFNSDFWHANPIKYISNQLSNECLFQMSWKVLMICCTKKVNIK